MSQATAAAAAAWFTQALGQPCRLVRQQAGSRRSVDASASAGKLRANEVEDGMQQRSSPGSLGASCRPSAPCLMGSSSRRRQWQGTCCNACCSIFLCLHELVSLPCCQVTGKLEGVPPLNAQLAWLTAIRGDLACVLQASQTRGSSC